MSYSAKCLKFLAITVNILFGGILNAADTTLVDIINLPYNISTIASDSTGTVWLTGARGLQYYHFGKETFVTADPSIKYEILSEQGKIVKFQGKKGMPGYPWDKFSSWLSKIPEEYKRVTVARDKFDRYWVSAGSKIFILSVEDRFDRIYPGYSTRGIYQEGEDLYLNTYSGILKNDQLLFEKPNFAEGEIKKVGAYLYFAWGGLMRYDPSTHTRDFLPFERSYGIFRNPRPISSHVLEEYQGTVWVGTTYGLGYVDKDSVVMVTNYPHVQGLIPFKGGLLVAGSRYFNPEGNDLIQPDCDVCQGVYLWQNHRLRKLDLPEINYGQIIESNDRYFMASDSGVVVWDGEKKFFAITEKDGITDNRTCSMALDSHGFLWVSTYSGLNRINLSNGKVHRYLENVEFNARSLTQNDSLIYMGSVEGVFVFNPREFLKDDIEPVTASSNKLLFLIAGLSISFLIIVIFLIRLYYRRKLKWKEVKYQETERKLFLLQIEQVVLATELAITVTNLAHALDISERTLYRSFEQYGLTPGAYLKELKLKKAAYLMGNGHSYSLKEVAQKVGYSESYLKKLLKEDMD